ncbi:hypothetical protein LCGC14_0561480 [marine sediment metagenome]|uniref:Uncharacterized protein n=1 Tax=marine sediment metagenome TaxID=412755 RepID=A0A0F9U8E2_9ZZZZ
MKLIIHDAQGAILRIVTCPASMADIQAGTGEFILEGDADDLKHKIIRGQIVNKTSEEIERNNPAPATVLDEDRPANITNKQLQGILDRLNELEK